MNFLAYENLHLWQTSPVTLCVFAGCVVCTAIYGLFYPVNEVLWLAAEYPSPLHIALWENNVPFNHERSVEDTNMTSNVATLFLKVLRVVQRYFWSNFIFLTPGELLFFTLSITTCFNRVEQLVGSSRFIVLLAIAFLLKLMWLAALTVMTGPSSVQYIKPGMMWLCFVMLIFYENCTRRLPRVWIFNCIPLGETTVRALAHLHLLLRGEWIIDILPSILIGFFLSSASFTFVTWCFSFCRCFRFVKQQRRCIHRSVNQFERERGMS